MSNSRDSLKSRGRESQHRPPYTLLNLERIVPLCRTETHKEQTMQKQAQVIVTTHTSKHKTRTKVEHMINEILKVLIEER
jgi:uncharacterized coiled-coil protein SlyX